jgi:hypothetical protein
MRTARLAALTALFATTAFVSAGPPWISVEYPANPYDNASRGAFLLVHAFHHGTPVAFPVSGTAEGLVDGARRTVSLEFRATSRPGVFAVHKQWPDDGVWTLVLAVTQGKGEDGNTAKAIVELGTNGQVARVSVPTRRQGEWTVPAPVSMADIEAGLRARAGRVASR